MNRSLLIALFVCSGIIVAYAGSSAAPSSSTALTLSDSTTNASVRLEADYILSCQYLESKSPAYGAINNVFGNPTWIVPGENAIAILGLVAACELTGETLYLQRAQLAAEYLVRVQDAASGAWYDQYSFAEHVTNAQSLRQTAEVMMALDRLGYDPARYDAMQHAARFLLDNQNTRPIKADRMMASLAAGRTT